MKIYVGNLSRDVSEKDLEKAFSSYGKIESVEIIINLDTGLSNGVGYIEILKEADAKKAIKEMNGKKLKSKSITVEPAKQLKEPRHDRSKDGIPGRTGRQKF